MRQSAYESLFEKFLLEQPDFTKDELEEMIKNKKKKVGAGYLTDQGALFLIASDLGIRLSNKPLDSKIERKPIQKIDNHELQNKFKNLKKDYIKKDRFGAIASILSLVTLLSALYFYSQFSIEFKIRWLKGS